MQHTPIHIIGKNKLLDRIRLIVDSEFISEEIDSKLISGISDDSAVFNSSAERVQLLTSKSFNEGIHFDLTFTSMGHLGWKVIVATYSNILAMGAFPEFLLINFSIPQKVSVEMIEEFYKGAVHVCKKYKTKIIGGDFTTTTGNISITVTAFGIGEKEKIIYRKGAKVRDLICVSGHLGAAHAGLKILQREKKSFLKDKENFKPNLEPYKSAIEKYLMPVPRTDILKLINEKVKINSMIDVSEGLATELYKICESSKVGVELWEHNIPIANITQRIAEEFSESVIDYALFGGEEYELLFTLTDNEYEILESLTSDVTILGRIVESSKGMNFIRENGERETLPEKYNVL